MSTARRVKEWVVALLVADTTGYAIRSADSPEARLPGYAIRVASDNREESFADGVEVRIEVFTHSGEADCYDMLKFATDSLLQPSNQWTVSPMSKGLRLFRLQRVTTIPPGRDGDPANAYSAVLVLNARGQPL